MDAHVLYLFYRHALREQRQNIPVFQCSINLFDKAYMEIAKQIIKGAHEMGKYCTVHSRGVARKRYCWVSQ